MARKGEVKVGDVRELRGPERGRYARGAVAKVEVLASGQPMESYSSGSWGESGRWKHHTDAFLVRVIESQGWKFTKSAQQMRTKPTTKKPGWQRSYDSSWEHENLPEGQLLVKAALLGPIWDDEAKTAQAEAQRVLEARQQLHTEAIDAQREALAAFFREAGVQSDVHFSWGFTANLGFNVLAKALNHALQGDHDQVGVEVALPVVEWADFAEREV